MDTYCQLAVVRFLTVAGRELSSSIFAQITPRTVNCPTLTKQCVTVDAPATSPVIAADKEPEEAGEDDTVAGGVLQKGTSDRGAAILDRMARSRRPNPRMIGPEWAK